jgi:oxygen-dependent protoporphyrinogen oxidase
VGHVERVKRIRELSAKLPGFGLVGNAYDGVGIPQCIRGARLAAAAFSAP